MTTRGLVLGCGGTLGFAWSVVALQAAERTLGWDARDADVIVGTSAGAELAAMLGSGASVDSILAALEGADGADPVIAAHLKHHPGLTPPRPALALPGLGLAKATLRRDEDLATAAAGLLPRGRGDATWLRDLGAELAGDDGWVRHPATWLVAVDTRSGERVAFGSPGAPRAELGDGIAASWAIPGWFPPVRIAGRDYLDGGAVRTCSADLVLPLDLDEVVVVAPMATKGGVPAKGLDRVERLLRHRMTRGLDKEIVLLERAGTKVIRLEPGRDELDAMCPNFMDVRRRPAVLAAARRTREGATA
ncbi:patatin-like phospholipase family protein [Nocardioides speluncae]|uniref:patatin-like phospholipase family protein n=1 Tax=Nocardioides speluncae TaxID=2670337 RepID=UPI000D696C1C|nr:patatin-like phospholipase family protein [Nocardioides speluncae]